MMMSPEIAILIMFVASLIIGYITMPIILGSNSPYVRFHKNKVFGALLMAFTMALVELFMHIGMLSIGKAIFYFVVIVLGLGIMVFVIQQQLFITKRDYLEGMIEHHAMGIAMAKKFEYIDEYGKFLTIPPVNEKQINKEIADLSRSIVTTQFKEIKQMDKLLNVMD
jgi:hypothetical protein